MTAEDKEFPNVFQTEPIPDSNKSCYYTEGIVVSQRFRKTK